MRATDVKHIRHLLKGRKPNILDHQHSKKAAVLLPLLQNDGQWYVLFQVRAYHLQHQPGDVCFPGGRQEREDADLEATAVRETYEEIGVPRSDIEIIAPLDVLVSRHSAMIFPYVAYLKDPSYIQPDSDEVHETFQVPLSYFLHTEPDQYDVAVEVKPPADFPYHLIVGGRNYQWRTGYIREYFYTYRDYVIWGMTARILHHFIELIREDLKRP